jgi:hypothetical protein
MLIDEVKAALANYAVYDAGDWQELVLKVLPKLVAAEEMKKALELMIAYCNAQPGTMGYPGTEAASALNAYRKAGEDNAD